MTAEFIKQMSLVGLFSIVSGCLPSNSQWMELKPEDVSHINLSSAGQQVDVDNKRTIKALIFGLHQQYGSSPNDKPPGRTIRIIIAKGSKTFEGLMAVTKPSYSFEIIPQNSDSDCLRGRFFGPDSEELKLLIDRLEATKM